MPESLKRLSDYFPAAELLRDGRFAHLDEAGTAHPDSLVFCQNLAFLEAANANPNVTAVITTPELADEVRAPAVAVSADPRLAFFRIYRQLVDAGLAYPSMAFGRGEGCDIHPSAVVSPRTRIGDRVTIAANAVIEDFVEIGDDS